MNAARAATLLLVATTALLLVGCGGGQHTTSVAAGGQRSPSAAASSGGQGSRRPASPASQAAAAAAQANCRSFLAKIKLLGKGVLVGSPPEIEKRINDRVIARSIPLLEDMARRQKALQGAVDNRQFDLYVNLFNPITVVAQRRLRSGRAGDLSKSKQLENQLTSLGLEQENAAGAAGLRDCDQDFERVMVSSFRS